MPLYEYVCAECGGRFTRLESMSAPREGHECPECGARKTRRAMSTFATSGTAAAESGCAPGSGRFR